MVQRNKTDIQLKPFFLLGLATALLLVPLPWLVSWVVGILLHESAHYLMLRLCGCTVLRIKIASQGVIMHTMPLTKMQTLLCASAGPVASLALLLTANQFPQLAICGAIQGLYNLLPLQPLDGGRIMEAILRMHLQQQATVAVMRCVRAVIFLLLGVLSIYMTGFMAIGPVPLLMLCILAVKTKIPCKEERL